MSKGIYSADEINAIDEAKLFELVESRPLTVGIDAAKHKPYARFRDDETEEVLATIHWHQPTDTHRFLDLLERAPSASIALVLESSGTYGDALLHCARQRGLEVFRVRTQAVNRMAEVFDSVPSLHDAKAADIVGRLHQMGLSDPWEPAGELERRLQAVLASYQDANRQLSAVASKLEALLARHWPELCEVLALRTVSAMKLLQSKPAPALVGSDPDGTRRLLEQASRHRLSDDKIQLVISMASATTGASALAEEKARIKRLAQRLEQEYRDKRRLEDQISEIIDGHDTIERIAEVVGEVTAAVIVSKLGSPQAYDSAAAYEKAAGLNLSERSSGKTADDPSLCLSKRGPSVVRAFLYLAALRQINQCPIFKAWHSKKKARDGGESLKSVCALMRKLIRGLYHVGRGDTWKPAKLFDLATLGLDAP